MHIPKNIPILDEEYMKRKRKEEHREAELASWRRSNRPSITYTEEQDKQFFVEGKITEEELAERTEARWRKENTEAESQTQQQKLLIREKKMAPATREFLKESRNNLIILTLCAWITATLLEGVGGKVLAAYIGYPIGSVTLLLAVWISRTLKRR